MNLLMQEKPDIKLKRWGSDAQIKTF